MNKAFFENLAIEAGTNDVEIVRKIYYGLIRKTIRDLGNGKDLVYPDFGEFYVKERKARKIGNVNTGSVSEVGPIVTVRFKPDYKLKEYVKTKNKS
jgi:nucleoid DNA-binding protein